MSMTGADPTTAAILMEEMARKHAKSITALGACFSADSRRIEVSFCPEAHEMSAKAASGSHPTFDFLKYDVWLNAHVGHPLTHCGGVVSTKGTADIWYCQKDNKMCFDGKTS